MQNISSVERIERGVLGVALLLVALSSVNLLLFTALTASGAFLLGEAFSGYCLLRAMMKKGRK